MLKLCILQNRCLLLEAAHQLRLPRLSRGGFGVVASLPVSLVIAELVAAKTRANRRADYVKSLGYYLNRFAAQQKDKPLALFTTAEVENWLKPFQVPSLRQTWRNRISTLFAYGLRVGHCENNPCDRIERISIDRPPPFIFTPAQSQLLLKIVPPVCKPYLILGMFAGKRVNEHDGDDGDDGGGENIFPVDFHTRGFAGCPAELLRQSHCSDEPPGISSG